MLAKHLQQTINLFHNHNLTRYKNVSGIVSIYLLMLPSMKKIQLFRYLYHLQNLSFDNSYFKLVLFKSKRVDLSDAGLKGPPVF